ncbi:MAG TPA: GTP cyclohydrolase I FolE [Actinomycetes bacterium]|nr:GTP cyclohydrolase I FolE [Actinomycetes bacterium]
MPDRDSEPTAGFDAAKVEQGVRLILEGIGEDLDRPGLRATPARVARMYAELTEGLRSDPSEVLDAVFEEGHGELILVREIPLYSLCEHHMVPFVGKAHVAYIPGVDGRITGLSKLARLVTELSRRLQVQERLTVQIADVLEKALEPRGVLVVIEAEHLCMSMRGIRTPGVVTVTSAVRGHLQRDPSARTEAMSLLRGTPPPT